MPSVTVMVQNSRGVPPALVDALLGGLRLAHERDVARRGFVPAGHDADERPMDLLLGQTHGVVVGAVRRARRALGNMAARQLGLVERPRVHRTHAPSRRRRRQYPSVPTAASARGGQRVRREPMPRDWAKPEDSCVRHKGARDTPAECDPQPICRELCGPTVARSRHFVAAWPQLG